jgi:superfamily II DNA or RNA helicase/DNA-binding XRE family transcriptional regulator
LRYYGELPLKSKVPSDYSARIKQLRQRFNLTQMRLAELMGISFASINRWENGQTKPSPLAWQHITRAEILGIEALNKEFSPASRKQEQIRETQASYVIHPGEPVLDFSTPSEIIRLVAEGERLAYGHLFNPAFATETSRIDPLPHQRIAVYDYMLAQPRLRFLLADDAGAGKTIMAGLYVREMLARRLIRRVLIVPPAGLISNWDREMHTLFGLPFRVVSGSEARTSNPFVGPESDLQIVSMDTLGGELMFKRLGETAVQPYDLVIFDEAHKLSADREPDYRVRKTDRYRLAEALVGIADDSARWHLPWSTRHLLLLTATPHMGKDFPYYCLWRLLEPEVLATYDAFNAFPPQARRQHFIRRTKEEMVRFDGTAIYPTRTSDTLSYELTQGPVSEQSLYNETTEYIEYYYNRARILNRSAARLAMSIFQRRLASSTYALLCSFERRLKKLDALIEAIRSGKLTAESLIAEQRRLGKLANPLDEKTADDEVPQDGEEENESVERRLLEGVIGSSLAELQAERVHVYRLLELAKQVYEQGQESKFERLVQILRDPRFQDEKVIIFTEHRDTLYFLVRRLEGIGFSGQVAQIHGGMGTKPNSATGRSERDEEVEFFRRPASEGGARYLVATDAAGEGINLQFCWLMINYDVPWNPARLEQRMGRIHRYKQKHDPVIIINLIAGDTREGHVLKTLLDKLERIRKELHSDKVFDVVGRLFQGVSIKDYMDRLLNNEDEKVLAADLDGKLTKEQVQALEEREKKLYGDGGDVKSQLPRLQENLAQEAYRRLLPGYVRRFLEIAALHMDFAIEGDLDGVFTLRPLKTGALDPLWPILEIYPAEQQNRLTIHKPNSENTIFLHPGEPFFDRLRDYVCARFGTQAGRGGVFVDPSAAEPYLFHLALVEVIRQADESLLPLARSELLDYRLVGLRQNADGSLVETPVEWLLLLRGGDGQASRGISVLSRAREMKLAAYEHLVQTISLRMMEERRQTMLATLPERLEFLKRGYTYQENELASMRARYREKADQGDPRAKGELTKIKERQQLLQNQRELALDSLEHEPDLISTGEISFIAHALVLPSGDPQDIQRRDEAVEAAAMQVAIAYEQAAGAIVLDVSTPEKARLAGLADHPGFDLLSRRPGSEERAIEVKGKAQAGNVDISENEWARACNLRDQYWLYVVYDCGSWYPRLIRIRNPWSKLLAKVRGFILNENELVDCKEVTD